MKYYNSIISILLHPLLLVSITCYFIISIDPAHLSFNSMLIAQNSIIAKKSIAYILTDILILPSLTMMLLWKLGFIKNFRLDTYKSRIIPLIAMITFLFWAWFTLKNLEGIQPLPSHFLFGLFISVSIVFLINPFFMISFPMLAATQCFAILLQYMKAAQFSIFPLFIIFSIIFTLLLIKKSNTKLENPLAVVIGLVSQLLVSIF
ncbi:MAG: hypothetical protein ACRC0A_07150 [Chitinophagaceae bacterium]